MTTPSPIGETHNTPTNKQPAAITWIGIATRDIESNQRPSVSSWLSDRATKVVKIFAAPQELTREQKISEQKGLMDSIEAHNIKSTKDLHRVLDDHFMLARSLHSILPDIFTSKDKDIQLSNTPEDAKELFMQAYELFQILIEASRAINMMESADEVSQELLIEVWFALQTNQLNGDETIMQRSIAKLLRDHYATFGKRYLAEKD